MNETSHTENVNQREQQNMRVPTLLLLVVLAPTLLAAQGIPGLTETKLGRIPDFVSKPVFEKHGWRLAAVIKGDGGGERVWVDGQVGPEYDGIGGSSLLFSPDGKRVAYAARKGQKRFVVVDGQVGAECDGIGESNLLFSPDGKRVAYAARKGQKQCVVVDGQAGPEYDGIGERTLLFSPDGKRVAYRAGKGQKQCVLVDGQAGPEYDGIGESSLDRKSVV
jgi:roadblock/LC7 domain-containing protein